MILDNKIRMLASIYGVECDAQLKNIVSILQAMDVLPKNVNEKIENANKKIEERLGIKDRKLNAGSLAFLLEQKRKKLRGIDIGNDELKVVEYQKKGKEVKIGSGPVLKRVEKER